MKKKSIVKELRDYLMITIAMVSYCIGWNVFLLPNNITTGGVPGISSVVYWGTGIPVQVTYFVINAFLLIAALKITGMEVLREDDLRCGGADFTDRLGAP